MADSGIHPERAQKQMGRASDPTTMKIYTHVMNRRHHDAANRVAEFAGLAEAGNTPATSGSAEP